VPVTTQSGHRFKIWPNLARWLTPTALDQLWVADLTYIRLDEEFAYLAVVIDAFSRRVIGWELADHLRAELALAALHMALASRTVTPGLIHHSDRGIQPGFNQSSQRSCDLSVSARQMPPQGFSSRAFCEASC
jgi:putative transposase